uniref:Protein YIPF n=1 Tax=Heligmosomoides polygyrus TaxID=6339 RepID=A0A183GEA9_HELPZ
LVFLYVVLVPVILSTILWQRKAELQYALSDLLCAYGYSLSIFIPVSILWTLDVNWFRWLLIIAAVSLSGAVLARALWPAFKSDPNKLIAYGSIFGVLLLHFLLAFTFKVYFFDAVHPHKPAPPALKGPLDSGAAHSNSQFSTVSAAPIQVLVTDRVMQLVSTASPTAPTSDSGQSSKENLSKSNDVKNVVEKEKATKAVKLNGTVAPPVDSANATK